MKKITPKASSALLLWAAIFLLGSPNQVLAVDLQAQLTIGPSLIQGCSFKQAALEVGLVEAFDELLISADFNWLAADPVEARCLGSQIQATLYFEAPGGELYFIPLILEVGLGDGQVATSAVSPRWDQVLCRLVSPARRCLPESEAKTLLASEGLISGFNVERIVAQNDTSSGIARNSPPSSKGAGIDIEAMLKESIDSVLGKGKDDERAQAGVVENDASGYSAERSLIAPALGLYRPASTDCERNLRVDYSVGSSGPCLITIEAVTSFEPQCPVNNKIVRTVSRAALNLTTSPIEGVAVTTIPEGPVMLSISLTGPWVDNGTHFSNQWALSARSEYSSELELLAQELVVQQQQCVTQ